MSSGRHRGSESRALGTSSVRGREFICACWKKNGAARETRGFHPRGHFSARGPLRPSRATSSGHSWPDGVRPLATPDALLCVGWA